MPLYIALLVFFQSPVEQRTISLTADCSDSAKVLANLDAGNPVQVRFSVAGNPKTCYAVTAVVAGTPVKGYLHGSDLAAVAEFERQRAVEAASIVSPAPPAASVPATAATPDAGLANAPHGPSFNDFRALDMKGRPVSAHSLKGKVNLVCFWSPNSAESSRELLLVARLFGQFKPGDVDAVAVTLSGDRAATQDALDDFHPGFRVVSNGSGIAARYNIDFAALPRTYVLNRNYEVIASGLHNKALENLVKKLIAEK